MRDELLLPEPGADGEIALEAGLRPRRLAEFVEQAGNQAVQPAL